MCGAKWKVATICFLESIPYYSNWRDSPNLKVPASARPKLQFARRQSRRGRRQLPAVRRARGAVRNTSQA